MHRPAPLRRRRLAAAALLTLALGGFPAQLGAGTLRPAEPASEPVAWSGLRFRASGWLGKLSAELQLQPGPPAAAGQTWVADLTTRFDPVLLPRSFSEIRAWFDPDDGSVAGFTKLSLGPKPDRKIYHFTQDGARRFRIEPGPGEAKAAPERWSHVKQSFHRFRAEDVGCDVVSDPAVLVFKLSSLEGAEQGDLAGHCVFSGKTLFRMDVKSLGTRRLRVDYRLSSQEGEGRRRGRVRAAGFRVVARPVAGELGEDPVKLDLYVEEVSRIPVQLTAKLELLGELQVKLAEVVVPRGARDLWAGSSRPQS